MGLLEAEARRTDVALELGRLASEVLAHERCLCHHALPLLRCTTTISMQRTQRMLIFHMESTFPLAGPHNTEHLVLRYRTNLRQGHIPLAGLLFPVQRSMTWPTQKGKKETLPLLFYHIAKDLGTGCDLTIKQIAWNSSLIQLRRNQKVHTTKISRDRMR
jgi:hypothetical protein